MLATIAAAQPAGGRAGLTDGTGATMFMRSMAALTGLVLLALLWFAGGAPDPAGNPAVVPRPGFEPGVYAWWDRHRAVLDLGRQGPRDLAFIGDSITHFFGGEPRAAIRRAPEAWDAMCGGLTAVNLGFGWDRTQNVLWRLEEGELDGFAPRVVVIFIGTNNLNGTSRARANTAPETVAGVKAVCRAVRERAPRAGILLLGLPPRLGDRAAPAIGAVNADLESYAARTGLAYLDPRDVLAGPDGLARPELMQDGIHPNAAGYGVLAAALGPIIAELAAAWRP